MIFAQTVIIQATDRKAKALSFFLPNPKREKTFWKALGLNWSYLVPQAAIQTT